MASVLRRNLKPREEEPAPPVLAEKDLRAAIRELLVGSVDEISTDKLFSDSSNGETSFRYVEGTDVREDLDEVIAKIVALVRK